MNNLEKSIGVLGLGMVGGTIYNYYKDKGYLVKGYSPSNQINPIEEITECEYIFICVPTPYNWEKNEYDLSILKETLDKCKGRDKKVIIKSTVPPQTTENLQELYPHLLLFFNPEFLSEKTAKQDFENPDRQIVGHTHISYKKAFEVLHLLPCSPYDVIMTSTEAEIVKYVNNFHGALMVIFANFIYDMAEVTNSQYDRIRKAAQASKWVGSPMGRMYWEVFHAGFRGYGGKCFPKDINTLIKWCKANKVNSEILEATQKANIRILKSQYKTEELAEKISSRN